MRIPTARDLMRKLFSAPVSRRQRRRLRPSAHRRAWFFERLEDRTVPTVLEQVSTPDFALPDSDTAGGVSQPKSSADGRYIVYTSNAPNLVMDQVNTSPTTNIFLYDQQLNTTTLVSHVPGLDNVTANAPSSAPRISGDGRYVAYTSSASNLVTGYSGPRGVLNVYLYDRVFDDTVLVSHDFDSPTTSGNESSSTRATSGFGFTDNTGRFLIYTSYATNLIEGQDGPNYNNLFLYDTLLDTSTLVSHSVFSPTTAANNDVLFTADISQDGNTIVYSSIADDLVFDQFGPGPNVFLYRADTGENELVSGAYDPFLFANSPSFGAGLSVAPVVSSDGRYVTYLSAAQNLVFGQSLSLTAAGPSFNVFSYDSVTATTILVSGEVTPFGPSPNVTSNGNAFVAVTSADGSSIAFISDADNLFPGQGPNQRNVFVANPFLNTLRLASRDIFGGAAGQTTLSNNSDFSDLSINADGRFITYQSAASNLVFGQPDTAGFTNVFVYDQLSDTNALISRVSSSIPEAGDQDSTAARISFNGTSIAFLSFATNLNPGVLRAAGGTDLYVFNQFAQGPLLLSSRSAFRASASSFVYGTNFDGRYVVFTTNATNAVDGQFDGNNDQDVFLLDRTTGEIVLVSHTPDSFTTTGDAGSPDTTGGGQLPGSPVVISQDGNWVAFVSRSTDLVAGQSVPAGADPRYDNVYLYSRETGEVTLVSHAFFSETVTADAPSVNPVISADGRYVAFVSFSKNLVPGLTGLQGDFFKTNIFLYDRLNPSQTTVLSALPGTTITGNGDSFTPSISDDGRYIAFQSNATNLLAGGLVNPTSNIYLVDRVANTTTLVSRTPSGTSPNGGSFQPVISPDGSRVVFTSYGTDLVSGQRQTEFTNIFLYDRTTDSVRLVSGVDDSATFSGSGFSDSPVVSNDAQYVAFRSDAPDLVPGQTGPTGSNIYLHDSEIDQTILASHAAGNPSQRAGGDSNSPSIDGEGLIVGYLSTANDLVPGQTGIGVSNVFGYGRVPAANFLASGINGSPTDASTDPAFLPIVSRDPIILFTVAGTLIPGGGGTINGYENRVVDIAFTGTPLPDGSPAGTVAGTLSTLSAYAGQLVLPIFFLPAAEAPDNTKFVAGATLPDGTASLVTQFTVNTATQSTFTILVRADTGLGIIGRTFALTATGQNPPLTVIVEQATGQADPTGDSPINFGVLFSQPVADFTSADILVGGTAGATTGVVTGSGTFYNVAVSGMTQAGTVTVSIPAGVATANGVPNASSNSTDNVVTFSPPAQLTVNVAQAAGQADPTSSSPVNFTVTFSQPVSDFASADVTVGGTAGATTAVVTGSGTTYNVAVSGMTQAGTVTLSVPAGVATANGVPNSASTSNDNVVSFSPNPTQLTVSVAQAAGQSDPTSNSPINFTVTFSQPVGDFASADVTVGGTAGATTAVVTGSGTTYNVAVSGMTQAGTVTLSVPAGVATANGVPNSASTSNDNVVTFTTQTPVPSDTTYIAKLYVDLLGRTVDAGGSAYWVGLLAQGFPRTAVVNALTVSGEYRARLVQESYQDVMNRPADAVALQNGVQFLAAGGRIELLRSLLLASEEFFFVRGGGSNAGFLTALYQSVLNRTIDAAALQAGQQVLATVSRFDFAAAIVFSDEAQGIIVRDTFQRYLGRQPDPVTLSNSVLFLQQFGPLEQLLSIYLASDEYFNRPA